MFLTMLAHIFMGKLQSNFLTLIAPVAQDNVPRQRSSGTAFHVGKKLLLTK